MGAELVKEIAQLPQLLYLRINLASIIYIHGIIDLELIVLFTDFSISNCYLDRRHELLCAERSKAFGLPRALWEMSREFFTRKESCTEVALDPCSIVQCQLVFLKRVHLLF